MDNLIKHSNIRSVWKMSTATNRSDVCFNLCSGYSFVSYLHREVPDSKLPLIMCDFLNTFSLLDCSDQKVSNDPVRQHRSSRSSLLSSQLACWVSMAAPQRWSSRPRPRTLLIGDSMFMTHITHRIFSNRNRRFIKCETRRDSC
jgi:hypothetical protein